MLFTKQRLECGKKVTRRSLFVERSIKWINILLTLHRFQRNMSTVEQSSANDECFILNEILIIICPLSYETIPNHMENHLN